MHLGIGFWSILVGLGPQEASQNGLMNRRRGRRRGPGSPLDRSRAEQAVLNPILSPFWTILESILVDLWTNLVTFLKPIKLKLGQSGT